MFWELNVRNYLKRNINMWIDNFTSTYKNTKFFLVWNRSSSLLLNKSGFKRWQGNSIFSIGWNRVWLLDQGLSDGIMCELKMRVKLSYYLFWLLRFYSGVFLFACFGWFCTWDPIKGTIMVFSYIKIFTQSSLIHFFIGDPFFFGMKLIWHYLEHSSGAVDIQRYIRLL